MGKISKRLLVICGPTATGKTALALHLSKVLNGEILSADSRQVYKYMDIGTGKYLPVNSKVKSQNSKIYGYDLVRPDEQFSAGQYVDYAYKKINEIYEKRKLPILVGGTGLYIKAVVDDLERVKIPPNSKLRNELKGKSADELFQLLMGKSPAFAIKLNDSDRKNPRRLIRALEVVSSNEVDNLPENKPKFDDVLWVGLKTDLKNLFEKIDRRVDERVNAGFEKEVEFLKRKDFFRSIPTNTLGYKDWPDIEKWKKEEHAYAKRQLTWFNRERRINWFDISDDQWQKNVEKLVKKWYK